jgi:hypothetical protein
MRVLLFEVSGVRGRSPVRPTRCYCTSVFGFSVLDLWINQGTQWFYGEPLKTPRTRCSLYQSPLMTRLPRSPSSTLVLRLNQETVVVFILSFLPHAACTWPRWPPSPSNQAYLSSPHLEASPVTTFRACSSPTPTPVKPQPDPAILSQESVHTTLSITCHTKKRSSTCPRTTHGSHVLESRWKARHKHSTSPLHSHFNINKIHFLQREDSLFNNRC